MSRDQCCICLDNLVDTHLQCSHEFCKVCLVEVLERDDDYGLSCPLCRNPTHITSDPEINQRIVDIEFNRNEYGTYYDWEKSVYNYVREINLFNGRDFGVSGSWYDIPFGALTWEIVSSRGSFYASSNKRARWTPRQCYDPRWNWPSHKMSDYYKLYKTPQITA